MSFILISGHIDHDYDRITPLEVMQCPLFDGWNPCSCDNSGSSCLYYGGLEAEARDFKNVLIRCNDDIEVSPSRRGERWLNSWRR